MNRIIRICPSSVSVDKIGRISMYSTSKNQIRQELIKMSQQRCSYCDCILHISEYTPHIEHFKPKDKFPNLEAVWHNLFASCPKCNEYKGGGRKYPPQVKPLKPDTNEYDFDYWFEIKWETYEILPNSLRDKDEQKRAEETIKWLGLNRDSRPISRGEIVEQFNGGNYDDWSYKFMLERK